MKTIGIVGSGQITALDPKLAYIASDGGYLHLLKQGIEPLVVIGDFDSLDQSLVNHPTIALPKQKNQTDTEVAIDYAIKKGYQKIKLYGVTGARLDHFIAVLCLMIRYQNHDLIIEDQINQISIVKAGEHKVIKGDYDYCSFYAIEDAIVSLIEFKYPLKTHPLKRFDTLATSNEWVKKSAKVITDAPLLVIKSKKR